MAVSRDKGPETFEIVYEGANESQLHLMFKVDRRKIKEATSKVKPSGHRRNVPIYWVHEIAPFIVKPQIDEADIVTHLKTMHHTDLPMGLRKEFWQAQKFKQDYEVKARDLWPTTEVIEKVGSLLKLVKMSAQLMSDGVERQVELTDRQRSIIKDLTNGMLEDLQKSIVEKFSESPEDRQMNAAGIEDDPL